MPLRREIYSATGCEEMDSEHRTISKDIAVVIDAVNASQPEEVARTLSVLIDAVSRHFASEERLMATVTYAPGRHVEAHRLFLNDLQAHANSQRRDGLTDDFRRWAVGRLPEWFRVHILAHDMGLAQLVKKNAPAPRQVA